MKANSTVTPCGPNSEGRGDGADHHPPGIDAGGQVVDHRMRLAARHRMPQQCTDRRGQQKHREHAAEQLQRGLRVGAQGIIHRGLHRV
jgi:hypothetical protein